MQYRSFIVMVLASMVLLVGCNNSGHIPKPPCATAQLCLTFRQGGDRCCGGHFKWIVRNNHPSRAVKTNIFAHRLTDGGEWVIEDATYYPSIPANSSIELLCPVLADCDHRRTYTADSPCFVDDPNCPPTQLPPDPVPPQVTDCATVQYKDLPAPQQAATMELFSALYRKPPYQLKQAVFEHVFGGAATCPNRNTNLFQATTSADIMLTSAGDLCEVGVGFPMLVKIGTTGKSFSSMWVTIPTLLEGVVRANGKDVSVRFTRVSRTIAMQLAVDQTSPTEYVLDYAQAIWAKYDQDGTGRLTITGEHVCLSVAGIPKD